MRNPTKNIIVNGAIILGFVVAMVGAGFVPYAAIEHYGDMIAQQPILNTALEVMLGGLAAVAMGVLYGHCDGN